MCLQIVDEPPNQCEKSCFEIDEQTNDSIGAKSYVTNGILFMLRNNVLVGNDKQRGHPNRRFSYSIHKKIRNVSVIIGLSSTESDQFYLVSHFCATFGCLNFLSLCKRELNRNESMCESDFVVSLICFTLTNDTKKPLYSFYRV